jgi:6-pyruvoyltetrahydropterin/6-carboxytetrahydropterin synthase
MFTIQKRMEISGGHCLNLPYDSKCNNWHGHNWIITVWCRAEEVNEQGMVVDFTEIKRKIQDKLDHTSLNDIEEIGWIQKDEKVLGCKINPTKLNPTAERIAEWICHQISECYKVSVQESEGNIATYCTDWQHYV